MAAKPLFTPPFDGMLVIEDARMTVAGEPVQVPRSLWERLFSLPWRPFKRTKTITPQVPNDQLVRVGRALVGHPHTIRRIYEAMERENQHVQ